MQEALIAIMISIVHVSSVYGRVYILDLIKTSLIYESLNKQDVPLKLKAQWGGVCTA